MTRVVAPIVGFRWGYTMNGRDVAVDALAAASDDDWLVARRVLAGQFSDWEFSER